ncbi:lantibiotic dehydratase [Archangium sp.]|jgi:hypothetical protein|uniref:lantibiotic dehydratase n=1 Tax=Archangium sp. TaxID=1872627 RepID=UPI002EDA9B33
MTSDGRWRLVPHFLLRRAGFPFSVIEGLAAPGAAEAASQVARAHAQAAELRRSMLGTLFSAEVRAAASRGDRRALRVLSRWRKRVGRSRVDGGPVEGWPGPLGEAWSAWREALRREAEGRAALEARLGTELLSSRKTLRALFREPLVREALFLLSPDLLETMEPALDRDAQPESSAADRAFERRLYAFTQRLGAKNETTSFFGPLTYGRVEPEAEAWRFGAEEASGVVEREAFLAFWAASALGKAASAEVAIRRALPVYRLPVSSVAPGNVRGPDAKPVVLEPATATILAEVDDTRTVAGLAERSGLTLQDAELEVRKLERLGLVRRLLEPASTTARPLDDVLAQLPRVPEAERWRKVGSDFQELLRRFARGALPERRAVLREAEVLFHRATALPARRAAGQTYADRTVLYEDCLGDMQPVGMPGREASRMEEALAPVLRLGSAYGSLRHRALRVLATEVLAGLKQPVTFLEFAAALDGRIASEGFAALDAQPRAFVVALGEVVARASDGRVARLSPEALAALAPEGGTARFASPDVMLAMGPDGSARFVLGEVHPYVFAWGSQGHFAPDRERYFATFRQDLSPWGGAERLAMVLRRRRHKGLVSDTFPGTFIEVTGRSGADARRRVAIADLRVVPGATGPELLGPHGPLTLYTGEDDHPHLRVFAPPQVEMPPVRLGEHTPRIEVGDCIFQRERWDLPAGSQESLVAARTPARLAVEVAALRQRLGLPRHLFALSPSEPKPVCLDLDVPFAHQHLQRLLSLGKLGLSEMMPGPAELWLRRRVGAHTSELRLAMVREP